MRPVVKKVTSPIGIELLLSKHQGGVRICLAVVVVVHQLLLITNVVPLLLGTFAESCSLILPQKGRKEGHAFLRAVA